MWAAWLLVGCGVTGDTSGDSGTESGPDSTDTVPGETATDSVVDSVDSADTSDTTETAMDGPDEDGDGYGTASDCDDADPRVNPGAVEICDLVDNDCDGQTDGLSECREQPVDQAAWLSTYADYEGAHTGLDLPLQGDIDRDGRTDLIVVLDDDTDVDGNLVYPKLAYLDAASLVPGQRVVLDTIADNMIGDLEQSWSGQVHPDVTGDGLMDWTTGHDEGPWSVLTLDPGLLEDPSTTYADLLFQQYGANYNFTEGGSDAADLDGDGTIDLLFGLYGTGENEPSACRPWSRVEVLHGPIQPGRDARVAYYPEGELQIRQEWDLCDGSGDEDGFGFGTRLTADSDVDGDGLADLLVAGSRGSLNLILSETLGVGSGSVQVEDVRTALWRLPALGRLTPYMGGADLNGDGLDDLVVGLDALDDVDEDAGGVWIVHGRTTGWPTGESDTSDGLLLLGSTAEARAGRSLALAGDADGDAEPDLVIGAPYHPGVEEESGRVYLCYGGAGGQLSSSSTGWLDDCHTSWEGEASSVHPGRLGSGLSAAGDVNQDGYADVYVAAYDLAIPGGVAETGMLYLLLGFPR